MATSEVNRNIQATSPMFRQGEIVNHTDHGPLLVSKSVSSDLIQAVSLSQRTLGYVGQYFRSDCRLFKGSVTLKEE